MTPVRVVVIEAHPEVRQALASRLASAGDVDVVAAASGLSEGLEAVRRLAPDVVLLGMGVAQGGMDPHPVASLRGALGAQAPPILVLTTFADEEARQAALGAGASGYLLKTVQSDRLIEEILSAAGRATSRATE